MKLILFYFVYPFFLLAFKNKNETQSTISPKSTSYEEIPLFIKEKPPVEMSGPLQDHIISSNIQTHTTFLGNEPQMQVPHLDHGFNMDNIDPDLQIVRSNELNENNQNIKNIDKIQYEQNTNPQAYSKQKNTEENTNVEENLGLDQNKIQNINGEAIQRLNRTHNLSKKYNMLIFISLCSKKNV